jgi:antitoxin component YwqK of YwqJK toxin-antitoxin module
MKYWVLGWLLIAPCAMLAQGVTRYTYHDPEKKNIKEIYRVKDTIRNVLHGKYISYFLNGNVESKGQFVNNETSGAWEFYYETGKLKMRGNLKQSSNSGLWEYFYESGFKSMEGTIDNKKRVGTWKVYYESGELKETGEYADNKRTGLWVTYFEDGTRRGEIEYEDDLGRYTEYYHSGKVYAEGPKSGTRNVGHWRYYGEDGVLQSEGEFVNGKKQGEWKSYYPSGKVSSSGHYENDLEVGQWKYFFEDGTINTAGEFVGGKKNGYWSANNPAGKLKSEITYNGGSGEYREYHASGKLKIKGLVRDGKNQGLWKYYYEDGKLEGECEFDKGKGNYIGYYPSGSLQTKGVIENDLRVGTWELYETDGKLSGYYKPVYDGDKNLANEINTIAKAQSKVTKASRKGFYYFNSRYREYKGVIIQTNPLATFIGSLPLGIEFYNEERLGHEFEFEAIRDPFYTADENVAKNEVFQRGYAIAIKQKFYNPMNVGMWYFAHEIRFTNLSHFSNVDFPQAPGSTFTASASEQRAEYGILLGSRLMKNNRGDGFTIDANIGYGIGYRSFYAEPVFKEAFQSVSQDKLSQTFRFGLNFGYSFSFDGRR